MNSKNVFVHIFVPKINGKSCVKFQLFFENEFFEKDSFELWYNIKGEKFFTKYLPKNERRV